MTRTHRKTLAAARAKAAAPKPKRAPEPPSKGHIFDDPDALTALAQQSFNKAAREAIEENDRLGVPSYGGKDGKIVVRQPRQAKKPTGPT
jgi:hypothetical protein